MKHEIEIEGLPEGWDAIAFRIGEEREYAVVCGLPAILTEKTLYPCLIVKKKQPRRIVLEETDEYINGENSGYVLLDGKTIDFIRPGQSLSPEHKIWREVKETDLSLHNADDKESLRLSVDECKEIFHCKTANTMNKIRDFLKDK